MVKYFKQQEFLSYSMQKNIKKTINRLKMEKFRQKMFILIQFEAILFQWRITKNLRSS